MPDREDRLKFILAMYRYSGMSSLAIKKTGRNRILHIVQPLRGLNPGFLKKSFSLALLVFLVIGHSLAQSNDDCLACHDDPTLTTIRNGHKVTRYIPDNALKNSVHSDMECVSCHTDAAVKDFPHPDTLKAVNCGSCHDTEKANYLKGVHGKAFLANDKNAPTCKDCHGTHNILAPSNPKSTTYKMTAKDPLFRGITISGNTTSLKITARVFTVRDC